jgi:hypothetical protein
MVVGKRKNLPVRGLTCLNGSEAYGELIESLPWASWDYLQSRPSKSNIQQSTSMPQVPSSQTPSPFPLKAMQVLSTSGYDEASQFNIDRLAFSRPTLWVNRVPELLSATNTVQRELGNNQR